MGVHLVRFAPRYPAARLRRALLPANLAFLILVQLLNPSLARAQSSDGVPTQERREQAREILAEALQWAIRMPTWSDELRSRREQVIARIGVGQALAGYPNDAMETAEHLESLFRGKLSNAISGAYVRRGDFEQALKVALETEQTCGAHTVSLCHAGATRMRILREKLRRGDVRGAGEMGFPADVVSLERGRQQAEAGHLQAAFSTWEHTTGSWNKDEILRAIIYTQGRKGDFAGALQTAKLLTSQGNQRPYFEGLVKEWMIDAAIQNGDWEAAHQTADSLPLSLKFENLLRIGEAEARAGLVGQTIVTFEKAASQVRSYARQEDPNLHSVGCWWGELVSLELRTGFSPTHLAEAEAFHQATGNWRVWCPIGAAQARMGDLASARVTQKRAGGDLWCVFTVIAEVEAKRGNVEGAIQTLLTFAWEPQRRLALLGLVADLTGSGNTREARNVADRLTAMEEGLSLDSLELEDPALDPSLSDEERDERHEARARYAPEAGQLLARALAKSGQFEEAADWARTRSNPSMIAAALLGLAQGLLGVSRDDDLFPY